MMRVNLRAVGCMVACMGIWSLSAQAQLANNGSCDPVAKDVPFQGGTWDLWSCVPDAAFYFDRIEIAVGKDDQLFELSGAIFVCADGTQTSAVFKNHIKDVQPGPLPHHEIWGADLGTECKGKVDAYLGRVIPTDPNPVIKEVAFWYTVEKAIPTVSEWGVVIMALLLLIGAKVYFSRRRAMRA